MFEQGKMKRGEFTGAALKIKGGEAYNGLMQNSRCHGLGIKKFKDGSIFVG